MSPPGPLKQRTWVRLDFQNRLWSQLKPGRKSFFWTKHLSDLMFLIFPGQRNSQIAAEDWPPTQCQA